MPIRARINTSQILLAVHQHGEGIWKEVATMLANLYILVGQQSEGRCVGIINIIHSISVLFKI
jgi:hypothetical protein